MERPISSEKSYYKQQAADRFDALKDRLTISFNEIRDLVLTIENSDLRKALQERIAMADVTLNAILAEYVQKP